jgi:acyl-CoA hydrolase
MRDGGTLQVGIGSLGDALVHAMQLRHLRNDVYRRALDAAGTAKRSAALIERIGGTGAFAQGIYGASEMFMDGFMHLYRSGILRRRVYDDVALQADVALGGAGQDTLPAGGVLLHAAFLLGSKDFYAALDALSDEEHRAICMTRVSKVNQLYGDERLGVLQRRDARFVNTCMNMTLLGAAASDGLEDGQVVSGVGGQYNFVAMAHALAGGRSILLFRSTRGDGRRLESNAVWRYGHATIPRHLRDIAISEYGIADLRGKTDQECIAAMLAITDSRFQAPLLRAARNAGKIARGYRIPEASRQNLPQRLEAALAPFRADGLFEAFPYGSDFTPEEQVLAQALKRLERRLRSPVTAFAAVSRALLPRGDDGQRPYLERMGLARPRGLRERVLRGLLLAELSVIHRGRIQGSDPCV